VRRGGAQKEAKEGWGGEREYSETILLLFARAGSTKHISFFIRLIGFKGLS
jgi:hypothetical protein